jgi:hypothetical protein
MAINEETDKCVYTLYMTYVTSFFNISRLYGLSESFLNLLEIFKKKRIHV